MSDDAPGITIIIPRGVRYKIVEEEGELPYFTRREREVFDLLTVGKVRKEIAATLNISIGTVRHHLHSIREKLGLDTNGILRKYGKKT